MTMIVMDIIKRRSALQKVIEGHVGDGINFVTITYNKSSTITLPAVNDFYILLQPSIYVPVDFFERTVDTQTQVVTV